MLKKLIRAIFARSGDRRDDSPQFRYPGAREVVDGNTAVILVEREASDAAGAYPAAPAAQTTADWAEAAATGHINASDRAIIFVRPESEHAAAAVTAGMSMTGLRATTFAGGQGAAFMHEAFYAAVGKRLPYVLNMGCRSIAKAALNGGASHDDYHSVDDTGFIQLLARNAQEAADLNLIARKTAELSLTPALVGQDGIATTDAIESVQVPERELIAEYLGRPDDLIDTPTPAQAMLYGPKRPRVPALWDVDSPLMSGSVQNQDAYMQATAAQRPYFFDHIGEIADRCMAEYGELTGRRYGRIGTYRVEDAEYLIVGMGSMIVQAEAVADWLRERRGVRVGVVNVAMFRPFPGDLLGAVLKGRKGVVVLERTDQPLAEDLPLMREVRACIAKCLENGSAGAANRPYPGYAAFASGELPQLYSGCYGLGARDLQPEALVGAVENMLPQGARRKFFYLSIDFAAGDTALTKDYPQIAGLAVRGSENPDLLPKGTLAIHVRADAAWGVAAAGRNLAATLADLAGWQVRGGPLGDAGNAPYQLLAGPAPIRVNCAAAAVDVLLAPDAGLFGRDRAALAALKKGGVLVLQSALTTPAAVWDAIPVRAQTEIVDKRIRVFYLDAARIAREEAAGADVSALLAGNAFQGAFFAASSFLADAGVTEERFLKVFEAQMAKRFAARGVAGNALRALQRGFSELREIAHKTVGLGRRAEADAVLPFAFKRATGAEAGGVGHFWSQAARGQAAAAHPVGATALLPAATGPLRDMTDTRLEHPAWAADKCTACGDCYAACPDAAIPGLVSTVAGIFETAVRRVENAGDGSATLRPALKALEKEARTRIAGTGAAVRPALEAAIQAVLDKASALEREKMAPEFAQLRASLGDFAFAATELHWGAREAEAAGSGGLFSLTVNPYACKGCGLCVDACGESALKMVPQTRESAGRLKEDWAFWLDLPNTPAEFRRNRESGGKAGALRSMLLDKCSYGTTNCGDGACAGCGEKSAVHLFVATATALMQPRVEAFVARIDDLTVRLDTQLRMKLTASVDLDNTRALLETVGKLDAGATLADLSTRAHQDAAPIGADWFKRNVELLQALKALRRQYVEGPSGRGRAALGMVSSTGSVASGGTYPYNPYPFPWTSNLFQDSTSVAMGIFEGHMAKMAEAFRTVRRAELELAGGEAGPDAASEDFLRRFDWVQFSDEEWALCPPVVAVGGADAMTDNGFQNLSRTLMSGKPVKILVLDNQMQSAACSGAVSSLIDPAGDFPLAGSGRQAAGEASKEIAVLAMAHRAAYVLQSTVAHPAHLVEGFIDGLASRRPAVFNLYAACPSKHGVRQSGALERSRLAVEGRAFPLFSFDPDRGTVFSECVSLAGNPETERDCPVYALQYKDAEGHAAAMTLPMTYADFAAGEGRFARHFQRVAPEAWSDDMVLLADWLKRDADDRAGCRPFIWGVDAERRLVRLLVSGPLASLCEDRLRYWRQLRSVAGMAVGEESPSEIADRVRQELVARLSESLGLNLPAMPTTAAVAQTLIQDGQAALLAM